MDEREEILLQNDRFYEALEAHSMDEIEALWSHMPSVRCIHPGGVVMEGWERDADGWKIIHHHGSLMAMSEQEEDADTFRYN